MRKRKESFLILQMGQEILYLLLFFAIGGVIALVAVNSRLRAKLDTKRAQKLKQRKKDINTLKKKLKKKKQPPIIVLDEGGGYFFPSGRAKIPKSFKKKLLHHVIPHILQMAKQYEVDIIEVVGHTDEVPLGRNRPGNLDTTLIQFLRGKVDKVSAADNTGLGMARAAAIIRVLLNHPRISLRFKLRPLSAGQTMLPSGKLSSGSNRKAQKRRRRIEIRLRRSSKKKPRRIRHNGKAASKTKKLPARKGRLALIGMSHNRLRAR